MHSFAVLNPFVYRNINRVSYLSGIDCISRIYALYVTDEIVNRATYFESDVNWISSRYEF